MIKLETQFVSGAGGFAQEPLTYTQIATNDTAAVYERSRDGKVKDYEVFLHKVTPKGFVQKFPNGKVNVIEDDTQTYPSSEQFGKRAWAFHGTKAKEAAMTKFNELTNKANNPVVTSVKSTPYVKTGGKRGRVAVVRPSVKLPNVASFTMNDLLKINSSYQQPNMYQAVKKMIGDGQLKAVGVVEKAGKGKKPVLYAAVKSL